VHGNLFATVGVHPTPDAEPVTVGELLRLADHPRILAIGETGLDYYRLRGDLEWQRERFRTHIRAARECGKPLVVHTRAAAEDTLRILCEERAGEVGGVMHCFTETLEVARAAADMGFLISRIIPRTPTTCANSADVADRPDPRGDRRPALRRCRTGKAQPARIRPVRAEEVARSGGRFRDGRFSPANLLACSPPDLM
jgi:Tat protein secretion system quality control protein TatD with DNase activity